MFSSIWQDIKDQFSHGNMLTRIIWVNIGGFLLLLLAKILLPSVGGLELYGRFSHSLMIGADWRHNLTHPWALVTHMFLHEGLWHLLWNMVGLYFFGRIVGGHAQQNDQPAFNAAANFAADAHAGFADSLNTGTHANDENQMLGRQAEPAILTRSGNRGNHRPRRGGNNLPARRY